MENEFNLISCVVSKLSQEFPLLNIYTTQIVQGFERPCIVVKIASCDFEKQIGDIFLATFKLVVDYYGEDKTDTETQEEYAQRITLALRHIDQPSIKALSVAQVGEDDCHKIQAVYKLRVRQAPHQEHQKMQKLELSQRLGVQDAN